MPLTLAEYTAVILAVSSFASELRVSSSWVSIVVLIRSYIANSFAVLSQTGRMRVCIAKRSFIYLSTLYISSVISVPDVILSEPRSSFVLFTDL